LPPRTGIDKRENTGEAANKKDGCGIIPFTRQRGIFIGTAQRILVESKKPLSNDLVTVTSSGSKNFQKLSVEE